MRSSGRNETDDSMMTDGNRARVSNTRRPSQQQMPRRISNMSESSNGRRPPHEQTQPPRQVTTAPHRLVSSMPPRRISSMSTDERNVHSFTRAQSMGRALLEEWPTRDSMDIDDTSMCSVKPCKEVNFSQYSSIHVYPIHECERKKSFKSDELKRFKTQVSLDVLRVEELIATCPQKRGNAVCHLIDVGALLPEELIGIDHLLCSEDAARKIAFERFAHAKLITRKQYGLYAEQLASIASKKSLKTVDKALMRARLAELQEKDGNMEQPRVSRSPAA